MSLMTSIGPTSVLSGKHLDLVICIDRSESMGYGRRQSKLSKAKHLTTELVTNLSSEDRVAVVTFDSTAEIYFPLAPISHLKTFETSLEQISERGNTCLVRGIRASRDAFDLKAMRARCIIILSDGRANLSFDGYGGFEGSVSLEKELKEASIDFKSLGISAIAIAIGTDAFIMPLKAITDTAKGHLIFNDPGNIQGLVKAIRSDTTSFPLFIKTQILEKRNMEVAFIPSELPAGQPTWSLESLTEHVAIVSGEIASTYSTVGEALVSNPSNQRLAKVALLSIEDDALKSYRERLPKTTMRVRSGEVILLDKSYRLELELDKDDAVDLKI